MDYISECLHIFSNTSRRMYLKKQKWNIGTFGHRKKERHLLYNTKISQVKKKKYKQQTKRSFLQRISQTKYFPLKYIKNINNPIPKVQTSQHKKMGKV